MTARIALTAAAIATIAVTTALAVAAAAGWS